MSTFLAVMKALPEIMAFVEWIISTSKELGVQADVKKNISQIHTAFSSQDADALKKVFNS